MIRHLIVAATAACFSVVAGCATDSRSRTSSAPPGRVEFLALLDSGGVPGLSIAIVSRDGVEWSAGFGASGDSTAQPVSEQTTFEAASLGKPVIAYAALRLVDKGLLALDTPLYHYAPLDELNDSLGWQITARMILSHTSGLQNERMGNEPLSLQFEPGSAFRYSGEGYQYLCEVLERVSGLPFDVLLQREVFNPLGMTRSSFLWQRRFSANAAVGHGGFGELRTPTRPASSKASTLQTTAHDYGLFLHAVMTGRGLSQSTYLEMLRPHVHVADGVDWGLGWSLERSSQGVAAWHHGDNSNSGFTAFTLWYTALQQGVVYFANSTTGLGITSRLLTLLGAPFAADHPALAWINYEQYNAPARIVRLRLEHRIRENGVSSALRLYEELKQSGLREEMTEGLLNALGYRLISLGRPADAVEVFKVNVREYPNSFNVYDSLGDAYLEAGQRVLALESYERSVTLNPANLHGVEMVRKLRDSLPLQ